MRMKKHFGLNASIVCCKMSTLRMLATLCMILIAGMSAVGQTTWYFQPVAGAPSTAGNWNDIAAGGGNAATAAAFSNANDIFIIASGKTATNNAATWTIAGTLNVQGTFTVSNSGTARTVQVGNLLSSGSIFIDGASGTQSSTLTVTGNFTQTAGTLNMNAYGTAASRVSTLNIGGDFSQSSGATITESGLNAGLIVFTKASNIQTYSQGGGITNGTLVRISKTGAGTLSLLSDVTWPSNVSINAGTVDFGSTSRTMTLSTSQTITFAGSTLLMNGGDAAHRIRLTGSSNPTVIFPSALNWVHGTGDIFEFAQGGTATNIDQNVTFNHLIITSGTTIVGTIAGPFTSIVGGDLTINGGTLTISESGASHTLRVNGNVTVNSGGTLNTCNTASFNSTLNLYGDLTVNGTGAFNKTSGAATSTINFLKPSGLQTISIPTVGFNHAWVVGNGSTTNTVRLAANLNINVSASFSVENGATLDLQNYILSGGLSGTTFNAKAGSTIITQNTSGLAATGSSTGAVQVGGARTYSTTANYTFNGSLAQITGDGITGANNLTINNTAGVALTGPVSVSGILNFQSGILTTTSTNLLTITNQNTTAIIGGGSGKYVNGSLRWQLSNTAGSYVFPVGKAGNYYPYTLQTASASIPIVTVEAFAVAAAGTNCSGGGIASTSATEYWHATLNSGSFTGTVSLERQIGLGTLDVISQSISTLAGDYFSIRGLVSGNSVVTSANISTLGFFRLATKSNDDCLNPSDAGTIGTPTNYTAGGICLASFDPANITNTSAASTACAIEYQWQSLNGTIWSDITNATNVDYNPPVITQSAQYRRLARSICKNDWTNAVATSTMILAVGTIPTLGGTITGAQRSCAAFNPNVLSNVEDASPCTPAYKWQSSTDLTPWTDIIGATDKSYDPPIISVTTRYRRLATLLSNPNWTTAVSSNIITVAVSNTFPITINPAPDTVFMQQGTAGFTVGTNITNGTLTYQWQVDKNDGNGFIDIADIQGLYLGANTANLFVSNPTYAMNNYLYRCRVGSLGCTSSTSNPGRLLVLPFTIVPGDTAGYGCGQWDGTVEINVDVNDVGPLNLTTNVLRQINLKLGSSGCRRNLSTYSFWVIAPDNTIYKFIEGFTGVTTNMWVDIKFRDHPALEKVSEYSTSTVQTSYFPFSIGYYGVEADDIFAPTFNGKNPNGRWKIRIAETDGSNGIAIEKAELIFGPPLQEVDVSGLNANNSCSLATCLGADGNIIIGTNSNYGIDDMHYPGPTVSGCSWNNANNNSAWFYFFASSTSAYITVSGLKAAGNTSGDMQLLVLNGSNGCVTEASGLWGVPAGGCPDNEAVNNTIYRSTNGGGVTGTDNIYVNGITANAEFNLTGLTPGNRYLLMIDGNGGASSSFYIEATTGCQNCILNSILPVRFSSFTAMLKNQQTDLNWQTSSELNNQYFQVERSGDGFNWEVIYTVEGAGVRSDVVRNYKTIDKQPLQGINYYRVKQVNTNGTFSYSDIRTVNNATSNGLSIFPNPGSGIFTVSGLGKGASHQIRIMDVAGKLIRSANTSSDLYRFDMADQAPGIYFIQVDGKAHLRFVNLE